MEQKKREDREAMEKKNKEDKDVMERKEKEDREAKERRDKKAEEKKKQEEDDKIMMEQQLTSVKARKDEYEKKIQRSGEEKKLSKAEKKLAKEREEERKKEAKREKEEAKLKKQEENRKKQEENRRKQLELNQQKKEEKEARAKAKKEKKKETKLTKESFKKERRQKSPEPVGKEEDEESDKEPPDIVLAGNLGKADITNPFVEPDDTSGGTGAGARQSWADECVHDSDELGESEVEPDDLEDMFKSDGGEFVYDVCMSILTDICLEIASPETQEDPQTKQKKRTAGDADFTPPENKNMKKVPKKLFQFSRLNDTEDFVTEASNSNSKKDNVVMKLTKKK